MRNSFLSLLLVVPCVLSCGAEDVIEPDVSPVGAAKGALETLGDQPVVSVTRPSQNGVRKAWVFVCDRDGNLRRAIANDGVPFQSWQSWTTVTAGCTSMPSAATGNPYDANSRVVAYVRLNDGNLWEAYWATPSQANPSWSNVSQLSGLGTIQGAPVITYVNQDLSKISVAVHNSINYVYTVDFNGRWGFAPVKNGTAPIFSPNTLRSLHETFWTGYDGYTYLTGRGLASGDDARGWVARRLESSMSSSFQTVSVGDFWPTGTPIVTSYSDQFSGPWIIHAHVSGWIGGSRLPPNTGGWTGVSCPMDTGLSAMPNSGWGYGRSKSGTLMTYSAKIPFAGKTATWSCQDRAGSVGSAVTAVFGGSAFYANPSRNLMLYEQGVHKSMGVQVR